METQESLESVDIGEPILEWEVDEFMRHERSRAWYILAALAGAAFIVYAVVTANFLFAVIILMIGVITLLTTFKEPERVSIAITTTGILVENTYYDYDAVRNFSIVYQPPDVALLYVDFHSRWHPMLSIPLEQMDPNDVREALRLFCAEDLSRVEERLTDVARRMYKL